MATPLHDRLDMARPASSLPTKRARRGLVIGPSEGGVGDVNVVVRRAPADETSSPTRERPRSAGPLVGYAHVNRWSLKARGAAADDTAARRIADELEGQPGFVAYALVRTGAREVVAVTIFETEAQLRRAMRAVAPSVRRHVRPLADAEPERRQGVVVHYRARVSALGTPAAASRRTR
jgi:hypothetical protein